MSYLRVYFLSSERPLQLSLRVSVAFNSALARSDRLRLLPLVNVEGQGTGEVDAALVFCGWDDVVVGM